MAENDEKWRLFIAVPIPHEVKRQLETWCSAQKAQLQFRKWVHAEDYHITVQFLGDTSPERLGEVEKSLKRAVAGMTPFSLEAAGFGTFGRPANPSVLWAGVRGEVGALQNLQQQVTAENRSLGFMPEERRYSPHITLARKYNEEARLTPQALEGSPEFGSWTADRLVVYRTHMHARPMYEVVASVKLA